MKEEQIANEFVDAISEKEVNYEKYTKDFVMPMHNPKCKKCHGLGRIGYVYDPNNIEYDEKGKRKRGSIVPCPNYTKEIDIAFKAHIKEVDARAYADEIINRNSTTAASFDELVTGAKV
jgi:ssDNA-binding Zn-finger/Zn-ribbon topoisomerase 1